MATSYVDRPGGLPKSPSRRSLAGWSVLGVTPAFLLNAAAFAVSAWVLVGLVAKLPAAAEAAADERAW